MCLNACGEHGNFETVLQSELPFREFVISQDLLYPLSQEHCTFSQKSDGQPITNQLNLNLF